MATPRSIATSIVPSLLPPGQPGKAYKLESHSGEVIYIPCSKSATRLLVTDKESENAFAVVSAGGSADRPIGFHYHREAHDVFLCIQGRINVWAVDQARTMEPGDFASVPPNNVHQYQVLGDHAEFLGLIIPGNWIDFFRFIGEPYLGPMWPVKDDRNPLEVLVPKLMEAKDIYDFVPRPDYEYFDPQPWNQTTDYSLPGSNVPYFLKGGRGPRYQLGGIITTPLITTAETKGAFTIGSIEGSSFHEESHLLQRQRYAHSHHCFYVVEGYFEFTVDGISPTPLGPFETLYIPKDSVFKVRFSSRYAKAYVFQNGDGLIGTLVKEGKPYQFSMIPEKPDPVAIATV